MKYHVIFDKSSNNKTKRGKIIVIEGSDGSGKATQVGLLKKYLEENNIPLETIDFPRYYDSFYGKFIARCLTGEFGDLTKVNPYLITFPYAMDRYFVAPSIRKWLDEGKFVVLNRYVPSNLVHQSSRLKGKKREEYIKWAMELEYKQNNLPKEDTVIFLYVPYKVGQKLMESAERAKRKYTKGKTKDIVEKNTDYIRQSEKAYLSLVKRFSHWVKINCVKNGKMRTRDDINKEIVNVLKRRQII